MTLLDHNVFHPTADVNALYTLPVKRRKKQILKTFATPRESGNWSNYDEIGALIEGVYEVKENSSIDQYERNFVNTDSYSKVDFRFFSPALVQDGPYEIIGCKTNFCSYRDDKFAEKDIKIVKTTPGKNVSITPEAKNPCSQAVENRPNVSTCKLNSSIRIKQQRTSMQRGRNQNKDNVVLTNTTHEYVTIIPPVLKRSSPVLSESRRLKNKNSNDIKDKRKMHEKIPEINDGLNSNAEKDTEKEHHYFQVEPEHEDENDEYEELALPASAEKVGVNTSNSETVDVEVLLSEE
ncbi:uncharacterized protein LOC130612596 [Hydractinia symbiolongicarpus]|uniref:uncharacterized protein LOC130612596 n=1 Tax=Hydractinia symbiolongicarpus TaxID=13093 RepID=UPI00254A7A12|nr:uncharacterized protein LOC130612596 [Hydractinia symbiolongicarpus]